MAGAKYLTISSSGNPEGVEATQTSSGAGDAGKIAGLDVNGKWDPSMIPSSGSGMPTKNLIASEALAAGDWINVWNDSGTIKVRCADASAGESKKADGYVLEDYALDATATVYFDGINDQKSGLTGAAIYYLSATTPGSETTTPPATATHITQPIGKALSATEISFRPGEPVTRV